MAIKKPDDIDELFSELKKESRVKYASQNIKPKHIKLELGKYALSNVVVQAISTSQLEYDEQQRTYFVRCTPFQPFVNDVIRYWDAGTFPQLKLALVSSTTNKVAIMHVSGVEVTKQVMDMSTVVSITLELDKENNADAINSTGIRMKMNVLVDDYEFSDELTAKRVITKQYKDAEAHSVAKRAKEIEDQKKAEEEKAMIYKDVLSALTEISKTDSSSEKLDHDSMIRKFLSVITQTYS